MRYRKLDFQVWNVVKVSRLGAHPHPSNGQVTPGFKVIGLSLLWSDHLQIPYRPGQKGRKVRKLPDVNNLPVIENRSPNHKRRTSSEGDFITSTPRYSSVHDEQRRLLGEIISNNDKVSPKPRRVCPLTPKNNQANRSLDDPTERSRVYSATSPTSQVTCATSPTPPFSVVRSTRVEKPFKCNLCHKNFKYFSNIKSHLQVVHKRAVDTPESRDPHYSDTCGNHVIQCDICLRHFKYATNLRAHRLVHSCLDYSPVWWSK